MPYNQQVVARARDALAALTDGQDVVEKRMIGGLCFMVGGALCCGVTGDDLLVRVGPAGIASALAQSHVRPMEFAGRPLAAFVRVAPEGYRDDATLATWLRRALAFVATLPTDAPAERIDRQKVRGD